MSADVVRETGAQQRFGEAQVSGDAPVRRARARVAAARAGCARRRRRADSQALNTTSGGSRAERGQIRARQLAVGELQAAFARAVRARKRHDRRSG